MFAFQSLYSRIQQHLVLNQIFSILTNTTCKILCLIEKMTYLHSDLQLFDALCFLVHHLWKSTHTFFLEFGNRMHYQKCCGTHRLHQHFPFLFLSRTPCLLGTFVISPSGRCSSIGTCGMLFRAIGRPGQGAGGEDGMQTTAPSGGAPWLTYKPTMKYPQQSCR